MGYALFRFGLAGLGAAARRVQGALEGGEIGQHQLGVDDLGVMHRVHGAGDVGHALGFEAAQHVHRCVGLAHLGQEAVAQALAARGALDQAGHVQQLQGGLDLALHAGGFGHGVEARIGDGHAGQVGLDGAEGAVLGGDFGGGQGVEEGGLADVGEAEDGCFHCWGRGWDGLVWERGRPALRWGRGRPALVEGGTPSFPGGTPSFPGVIWFLRLRARRHPSRASEACSWRPACRP